MAKTQEIWATGRRKCAIARVRIAPGTGKVKVNGKALGEYFPTEEISTFIFQPLAITENNNKLDIHANIKGGGPSGQAGAFRHGLARALVKMDESLRPVLKNSGLLTRDARVKERKKPGQPGARKRFQFSKR
ncbi:30S ribosomal protein S9 [Lentisphaerota bacterium ZTH]|nr:30S ribosomal protein S9 [Lentisphaerota bacterium]WET06488.1 30S ribosomal protein S9 [Lentisphaerota bacterium ZTH]